MAVPYLGDEFSYPVSSHEHRSRYRTTLDIPFFRNGSGERSFKYRAVKPGRSLD